MNYFLIISCVVSGWAILRVLGAERVQMVKTMESQLRRQEQHKPAAPAESAPPPAAAPTGTAKADPAKPPAAPKPKH